MQQYDRSSVEHEPFEDEKGGETETWRVDADTDAAWNFSIIINTCELQLLHCQRQTPENTLTTSYAFIAEII